VISRLLPDRFILWLLGSVALGLAIPASGLFLRAVDAFTLFAIFALFFLHGVRLPREALIGGVRDWRLHLAILAITFALFPIAGLVLSSLFPELLAPELWTGLLFLCALPSTVQSAIAYTSIARGNVAGAVAAAAFSNLIGVFMTPLLVTVMLGAESAAINLEGVARIFALLFLPFLVGHALRNRLLTRVNAHPKLVQLVDKGTILLAVYGAFSAATVAGIWNRLGGNDLFILSLVLSSLLAFIIAAAWLIGRLGRFSEESRAAILFCGSVKSLASGAPMARILFPGAAGAVIILPIMIFHTLQLILCAWIAAQLARNASKETDVLRG
jgi:sodium/bile acid cotransporter 7